MCSIVLDEVSVVFLECKVYNSLHAIDTIHTEFHPNELVECQNAIIKTRNNHL